jgi:hypothetical protein
LACLREHLNKNKKPTFVFPAMSSVFLPSQSLPSESVGAWAGGAGAGGRGVEAGCLSDELPDSLEELAAESSVLTEAMLTASEV